MVPVLQERPAPVTPMDPESAFEAFAREVEPKLWRALVPAVGPDRAAAATNEALAYAWRHWERVAALTNPAGYLYRAAYRVATRPDARPEAVLPPIEPDRLPDVEPGLRPALLALSEMQRTVVWLVAANEWTLTETAELLGVSVSTVRNHLGRGMDRLRSALQVQSDA